METLIAEIERFCTAYSLTESQFGIRALNDKRFVAELRKGREARLATRRKAVEFMDQFARNKAA